MLEHRYSQRLEVFRKSISEIQTNIEPEQLWNLTGYNNLISKAQEMIKSANSEIYLSAWQREVIELEKYLRDAEQRGVKIVVFSFTSVPQIGRVFSYDIDEQKLEKVWDHKIILVRDHEELLMGEANRVVQRKAAWTLNKAIVQIAENHIILDITLYGLRAKVNVNDVVIENHPGELDLLAKLLKEKFPESPLIKMDFSKYQISEEKLVE